MNDRQRNQIPRSQKGAVLFFALVILVIMSLIAVVAANSSILQERMIGGMRNQNLSFQGAESALRGAEAALWNISFNSQQPLPPCVGAGSDCVYLPLPSGLLSPVAQRFRTAKEWIDPASDGGRSYTAGLEGLGGADETAKLASAPRFIIENVGPDLPPGSGQQIGGVNPETTSLVGKRTYYRITARSQGGSDAAISVTESVFSAMDLTNTGFNP